MEIKRKDNNGLTIEFSGYTLMMKSRFCLMNAISGMVCRTLWTTLLTR